MKIEILKIKLRGIVMILLAAAMAIPMAMNAEPEPQRSQLVNRLNKAVKDKAEKAVKQTVVEATDIVTGKQKSVSVDAMPKSVEEFKALREEIGKSPEGVVALQVIALGMYSEYGQEVGEPCLDIINTTTGLTAHARGRLREWYVRKTNDPRPYQAASYMKGATPENGYNPTKPYTMVMTIDDVTEVEDGYLITVRLRCQGFDSSKDVKITVKQPYDDEYYYINANPSMYMKVKALKRGVSYNGIK